MQLFRDGALRGFALAGLSANGSSIYTEADFKDLAATGANVVRVPVLLRKCDACESYDDPDAEIRYVERVLAWGEQYGFRVIVTLHPMPGFSKSDYWGNANLKADIVRKWGQVASRLRSFAALQAYDLINEPVVPGALTGPDTQAQWHDLAANIARELRAVDPDTPLMIEPTPWGIPRSFREAIPLALTGVVYSFHLYAPHDFTHQGLPGYQVPVPYPGNGWDKARLSQALEEARRFATANQAPMFIGEFSCVRWAPDGSCPRYLSDAISLLSGEGWGWTYHCWRCYHGWDSEVPEDIPMEQRTGQLPEFRRPDSPTILLLRKAMKSD